MKDKKFAKLYENDALGQILVKIDSAEDDGHEAEVRIFFEPEGFGVCSTAYNYKSWEDAEEAFDKVNEELCVTLVKALVEQFGGFASE